MSKTTTPLGKGAAFLAYLGLRAAWFGIGLMPQRLVYGLGRFLGGLIFLLDRRHREAAGDYLRLAFPGAPESEIRRRTRQAFDHFVTVILESALAQKKLTSANWRRYVEFPQEERLRQWQAAGQPVVFLAPHLGNWEFSGWIFALAGLHFSVLARPLNNPYMEDFFRRHCEARGATVLPRRGGFARIVRDLREGKNVALLPDQNQRKRPLFVDFFGKKAATDRSAAFLGLRFGVPLVMAAAIRQPGGFRFRIESVEVGRPRQNKKPRKEDLRFWTEKIHAKMEEFILRYPEQYFWLHNRYKTRPPSKSPTAKKKTVESSNGKNKIHE